MLYGMAEGGSIHRGIGMVGSRGTPYMSVAAIGLGAAGVVMLSDIKTVAQLTDLAVFMAYIAVNASVIALAGAKVRRGFTSPRLAGTPVFAWLGIAASFGMLFFFPPGLWLAELAILAAGLLLFLATRANGRRAP
jgi:amino acid permease